MLKTSKNKAAAWKFLQYLLSKDAQLTMAKTGQIPVLKSLVNDPYIKNHAYYGVYLKQLKTARARPPTPPTPRWKIHPGVFCRTFFWQAHRAGRTR